MVFKSPVFLKLREAKTSYQIWIPILVASPILFQMVFKPIDFLFADDWLLVDYLNPENELSLSALLELVNGHNVAFTKVILTITADISHGNQLLIFGVINLCLAIFSCILLVKKYIPKSSRLICLGFCILFFNFKQFQNYNMIISGHFIHSLFFISLYLYLTNSRFSTFRWIALSIAPFTGALGTSILFLEVILQLRDKKIKKSKKLFISLSYLFILILTSYIFQIALKNQVSNLSDMNFLERIINIVLHPWLLPSYWLGSLSAPFIPSSSFMLLNSQLFGLFVMIIIFLLYKKVIPEKSIQSLLMLIVINLILFSLSGYDGSLQSIQNSYSNRYVSSLLFVSIFLYVSAIKIDNTRKKVLVSATIVLISFFAGGKSGYEWVQVRSSQSAELQRLCSQYDKASRDLCVEKSFRESFFTDNKEFEPKLRVFLSAISR